VTRRVIVLLVLAGAGLTLLSSGRPWVSGQITDAVAAAGDLSATGSVAAPGVGALALVSAAGAVVLATAGRRPVQIAAVVLAAGGLAVVLLGGSVLTDPADALRGPAAQASGTTTSRVDDVRRTAWIPLGMTGGALVLTGGLLALVRSAAWAGPSRRYERAPSSAAERPSADDEPLWDAISRGDDPTAHDVGPHDLQQ
jgi:uncharacterized membrane protein (TIGR02234 family)